MAHVARLRIRKGLGLLALVAVGAIAACDQPSRPAEPASNLRPQMAAAGMTTVTFSVTRKDTGAPVANVTISVYLGSPLQVLRTITDANGVASVDVPQNSNIGYLARVVPPEWLTFAAVIAPPLNPGPAPTMVVSDLGAVTCARREFVDFNRARFADCISNLYYKATGPSASIPLVLPVQNPRSVTVKGLNGGSVAGNAFAYLIEEVDPLPGNTFPTGVKQGLLRGYGPSGSNFPGAAGFVEVFGTSTDGFQIAGTEPVGAGTSEVVIETAPVICANPTAQPNVFYSLIRKPTNNALFQFTGGNNDPAAIFAYGATRGSTQALDKDITTTAVVVKFTQAAGVPATVELSQRVRLGDQTFTASASVVCTNGMCDMTNVSKSMPGASNPLVPFLYQPANGKLYFVVRNVDSSADSEWAAKASFQGGSDQLPVASKSGPKTTSAYIPFSKGFTLCHPDFSFDGGWGIDI